MSKYQVMPALSEEQYEALKADIDAAGVRVPIEVDENGEIIDGHHRKAIADELGKECPEVVIRGLEEFEKLDRAFVLNATRRHFDREQKRAVVAKSLKLHPRLADREHARRCGVSHPTVSGIRAAMEAAGQLESFTSRLGGDGRERPAHNESTKTSGPAATSPAGGSGENTPAGHPLPSDTTEVPSLPVRAGDEGGQPEEDHRGAIPGEAGDGGPSGGDSSGVDGAATPAAQTEPEGAVPPHADGPVDGREQQAPAGVSVPAAPVSKSAETEDEQAEREEREYRSARSLEFATGLVNVRMRLEPDPVSWYQNVYVHGLYHARNLPRVRDSFTPVGLRQAARFLEILAAHLEETGEEL